jgi:hypothetical protein
LNGESFRFSAPWNILTRIIKKIREKERVFFYAWKLLDSFYVTFLKGVHFLEQPSLFIIIWALVFFGSVSFFSISI